MSSTGLADPSESRGEREAAAETAPSPRRADGPDSVASDLRVLLRDRRFRTLFVAHFASNLGDWLAFMALFSMSAFEWGNGVGGVSLLAIAYTLPLMTLSPVAGVWIDRWDLRRVLVWCDLLRAGVVLAMAFSSSFAAICLLLLLHQGVSTFFGPAQHAAIPRLVQKRHLLAANALNTQASHFTKILGPSVAGVLVSVIGARGCFYVDAATFALSAWLLATLPSMPRRWPAGAQSFARDLRSGVRYLLREPRLRTVVALLALSLCALGGFIVCLPIFARDALGAGPSSVGLLLSGLGVGAAAGAFGVVHTGKRADKIWSMVAGAALVALALWGLSVTTSVAAALLATSAVGCGVAALLVPAHALVQEETAAALLGRVVSLIVAVLSLAQVAGMALAGVGARALDPARLLVAEAALLGAATVTLALWRWRRRS
ncbi:MAG: MFS transporter [Candidatus Latescibacterota bacterium]|nr:MAG: MFS transporter [Candidatus Latescibacterota bacterium]